MIICRLLKSMWPGGSGSFLVVCSVSSTSWFRRFVVVCELIVDENRLYNVVMTPGCNVVFFVRAMGKPFGIIDLINLCALRNIEWMLY